MKILSLTNGDEMGTKMANKDDFRSKEFVAVGAGDTGQGRAM